MSTSSAPDRYRIGAVSRLTGIPPVTLRAWERRYSAVTAERDRGGSRLYSAADVERLVLIKRLVDMGNAISTVAGLPLEELQQRIASDREQLRRSHAALEGQPRTIAVAGLSLARRVQASTDALSGLEVLSAQNSEAELSADLRGRDVDVIVLEYMTLHEETLEEIRSLMRATRAMRAVVVYGFARRALIERLEADDVVALAAPVNLSELRLVCLAAHLPAAQPASGGKSASRAAATAPVEDPQAPIPARLFSAEQLQRLSEIPSSVECECPRHLSSLVRSLVAFELYSAQCEDRNPDDAALHAYLHRTTASARAAMETALHRLAEAEGLLED